jgi:hypothetical protein
MDTKPRDDVESNIRGAYEVFKRYEESSMLPNNSKEKARLQKAIDEQIRYINREFAIYNRLHKGVTANVPDDIQEIARYFNIHLSIKQDPDNNEPKPIKRRRIEPPITVAIIGLVSAITVAIIGLVGAIIARPDLDLFEIISHITNPTTSSPIATPVPFAVITSLDILESGNVIDTVYQTDKDNVLPPSQNLFMKVNINTNVDLSDLVFRWDFCHSKKNIEGQGAVEIPYTLSEREVDCVTVTLMRGGERLNTANFFISGE